MPINISQESYERVKRSASPVSLPKSKKIKTEHADSTEKIEKDEKPDVEVGVTSPAHFITLSARCAKQQELRSIIK